MERLSPLDASFLEVEDSVSHMHIGSVAILEGPAPSDDALHRMVTDKLPLLPRYRQLVRRVPLELGRPVWVDDPDFNLSYHLRRTGLASPGGEEQLQELVGRVMSHQLDRGRPLWEVWVVEGLQEGRWALLSKTHHCMVDGVSASDLLTVLLDPRRNSSPRISAPWRPQAGPGAVELLTRSVAQSLLAPYEAALALMRPLRLIGRGQDAARGLLRMRGVVRPAPPSSLNGALGPNRRWIPARTRLSDISLVREALGGTVNDVVLACITAGFRDLLIARGESVDRVLRTLVPVSVRGEDQHDIYDNRVSAIFAELPVGIEDPVSRLVSIRMQMADLKSSKEAVAGEVLTSLGGFAPPMLLALAERVGTRVPQRSINTVTTNVPGPQHPLYAAGRRMLEVFPYVPLGGHVRVGVAIFSYNGGVSFGITGDYDTSPDIGVLADGIEAAMDELIELACPQPRVRRAAGGHARGGDPGAGSRRPRSY